MAETLAPPAAPKQPFVDFWRSKHDPKFNSIPDDKLLEGIYQVEFSDKMSEDEFYNKIGVAPPPMQTWMQTADKADATMRQTAETVVDKGSHPLRSLGEAGEGAVNLGSAILNDVPGFAMDFAGSLVHATKEGVEDIGHAGLNWIPGIEKADELLGAKPGAWKEKEKGFRKRVGEQPIETAANMLAIPGALINLPKAAYRAYQAAVLGTKAGSRLLGGRTAAQLDDELARLGPGATALDAMSNTARDAFLARYIAPLSHAEIEPLRQRLIERGQITPDRWRRVVEQAGGLGADDLYDPQHFIQQTHEATDQIRDAARASAATARTTVQSAADARHAQDIKTLTKNRDAAYNRAYTTGPTVDLSNFSHVLETNTAGPLLDKMNKLSEDYAKIRDRGGMPDLEKIDKIEFDLTQMANEAGVGTAEGQLAAQLARKIREELSTMDLPDYKEANRLHGQLKETPKEAPRVDIGPDIPDDLASSLDDNERLARDLVRTSRPGMARVLSRADPQDIRNRVPEGIDPEIIQRGADTERTFDATRRSIPHGREPDVWRFASRYGGMEGAAAAGMYLLGHMGFSPTLLGTAATGAGIWGAGRTLLGANRRRIGRRALRMLTGQEPIPRAVHAEIASPLDIANGLYLIAKEFGAAKEEQEKEHH